MSGTPRRPWTAGSVLARAREILAEEGPRALGPRALSELGYRRLRVIERSLAEPIPELAGGSGLTHAVLAGSALTPAAIGAPVAATGVVSARAAVGDICFILAMRDGAPVHRCWVALETARFEYLGLLAALAPGSAYVYDAVTPSKHRGRGLSAIRSSLMLGELRERGLLRAVSAILPENRPALPPPERVGYRPIGTIGALCAGRHRRPFARIPDGILGPLEPLPHWPAHRTLRPRQATAGQ